MAIGDKQQQGTRVGDLIANCPDSHAEIAAKVGIDKSLVTRWRSGARKPTDAQMARLEELYGGAYDARCEQPPAPDPEPPTPLPAPRTRPAGGDVARPRAPATDPEEGNNERLQRFIREGIEELELDTEISGVKRAEALKKLVDAQVALDKSTGENALTMAKIAAHPEFRRVVRLITEALAAHPEALAKVLAVLKENP